MKKIFIFIFLTTFISISLALPLKVFALECSAGISGQFLDENGNAFNFGSGQGVGWQLTINGILDPSSNNPDHMRSGLSDSQGNFNIPGPLNGTLVLSWIRNGYFPEQMALTKCAGIIITLKLMGPNTNPRCGTICSTDCAGTTDNCTSCIDGICADPSWGGPLQPISIRCKDGDEGVNTALGCIPIKPSNFVNSLLKFSIGIGGGIAFLLMIFGGFQIILSSGNPEKIKAGKEMITAAITGLLLIIFSILILKFVGVDILGLPGFLVQKGGSPGGW